MNAIRFLKKFSLRQVYSMYSECCGILPQELHSLTSKEKELTNGEDLSSKRTSTQHLLDLSSCSVDVVSTVQRQGPERSCGTKNSGLLRINPKIAAEATGLSAEDAERRRSTQSP